MKVIAKLTFIVLLFPSFASAGSVHGDLREDGKVVGPGRVVRIQCGSSNPVEGRTDDNGSYRLYVRERGRCTFTLLNYKGQSPSTFIYSYDDPVEYNFDLVLEGGHYLLKRR